MADLRKNLLGRSTPKRSTPVSGKIVDFRPVNWSNYFDGQELLETCRGSFNIYRKGNKGPLVLCLHGGGYSGLTWALLTVELVSCIEVQVVAMDLRGHGNSKTEDDGDLTLETMAADVGLVASMLTEKTQESIILIGHSMGGAVAVEVAGQLQEVIGLCVIDVVEGTALDALSSMQSILRGRPAQFKTIQHAIQWCFKGGQTHNITAARVSMPGQIVNSKTKKLAAEECDSEEAQTIIENLSSSRPSSCPLTITEEEQEESSSCSAKPPLPNISLNTSDKTSMPPPDLIPEGPSYSWRIDLSKTEQFWNGWFKGLSQKFLDVRAPKILLLANIHGLDTALTVGQMQGKFQMQVLAKSGHAIHEDQPEHVCEVISAFLAKQKLAKSFMY